MSRHHSSPYWAHSEPEPAEQQADPVLRLVIAKKAGVCTHCGRAYGEAAILVADGATIDTCAACRCPGICNRDWREHGPKLAADAEHLVHGLTLTAGQVPVPGAPIWCEGCAKRIARCLLALPEAFAYLELDKLHGTQAGGEHVSGSKAPPSPSPSADVQDELVGWLTDWEDEIRQLRGDSARPARLAHPRPQVPMATKPVADRCPWPRVRVPHVVADRRMARAVEVTVERRETATLTGAVRYVAAHLDWALACEDVAVDLGRQVLAKASGLRRRARLDAQRVKKPVPCPRCQLKTLWHEGGEAYISCENPECGRLLSLDEYDEIAAERVRDAKKEKIGA